MRVVGTAPKMLGVRSLKSTIYKLVNWRSTIAKNLQVMKLPIRMLQIVFRNLEPILFC